jgi:predicted phage tail protein
MWVYAAQDSNPLFAGSFESSDLPPGTNFGSEYAQHIHPPLMQGGFIFGMAGAANNRIYFQPYQTNVIPLVGSSLAAFPIDKITAKYGNPMALPASITPGAIWVLSSNLNTPDILPVSTFRVVDITEKETHVIQITGITYNRGKYDEIDFGIQFEKPLLTGLPPINYILAPNNPTSKILVRVSNEVIVISIQIDWQEPPDLTVRSYRLAYRFNNGTLTYLVEQVATTYVWDFAVPGSYTFQIQAINIAAVPSTAAVTSIVVPDLSHVLPHRVSGLELRGQGSHMIYEVLEPVIDWRLNSPSKAFDLNSAEPYGANTGSYDPYFVYFLITVRDANTNIVGWQDTTTNLSYQISLSKNIASWSDKKARHRLAITVAAINSYNVPAPTETITIDNPPPPPVAYLTAQRGESRASLMWIANPTPDLTKINIYQGISASSKDLVFLATQSANSTTFITAPLGLGTVFFGVTQVDTFGSESNMSALVSVTIT